MYFKIQFNNSYISITETDKINSIKIFNREETILWQQN